MSRYNPNKIYKDKARAKCMGVCAGLADYFGVRVKFVRLVVILAAIFTGFWPVVIAYVTLGCILDNKPQEIIDDPEEEKFWQDVRTKPDYTVVDMKERFRDMEKRTQNLEAYVTSKRFHLDRQLRALED